MRRDWKELFLCDHEMPKTMAEDIFKKTKNVSTLLEIINWTKLDELLKAY